MRIFTTSARVLLAILVVSFSSGCGGGGSKDLVTPQQPEVVYRLILLDHDFGGKIVSEVEIVQGVESWFWVRLESKIGDKPWTVVTQEFNLDVTIEGSNSGNWMPDIGLTGLQFRLKAGEYRLEFHPSMGGHLGTAKLKIAIPELGTFTYFWVTVVAPDTLPPPPVQTCRDLHPNREVINGYWWDCIDGVWQNTGESVDQPPPPVEELHAYGVQGELRNGGTITISEGNGYRLEWYLGDSRINDSSVTFESSILPSWCWDPLQSEIMTVKWANPNNPDPGEPGNMFVIPGSYQATFHYDGKSITTSVVVTDRVNFP